MKRSFIFREMKSFLILWGSQSVSSLGSAMTSYALIIWVYRQQGTATSIALLSLFTYLPSILFCFIAGAVADRWDKKRIMLLSDLVAALGTVTVFGLYAAGNLQIWHLYLVNFLISFMNAFQNPASYVAVSQLAPKDQYMRVSGLQSLSGSLVTILTPALATAMLAFGGLETVFAIDLLSFAFAFLTLLFFIKIPPMKGEKREDKEPFYKSCVVGLKFLKEHRALLQLILFFSLVNLLAYMSGYGIMPAMILARSGDDQRVLGMVSSAVGIGTLIGSVVVTALKPEGNRIKGIFLPLALSFFLGSILWGVGRAAPVWIFAGFAGQLPLPYMSANITTIMRTEVPLEMQGRVFSARDTLQYCTIPLGLFLGGFLADHVFEPLMMGNSPLRQALSVLVGTGQGSGMGVMFLMTGIIGCVGSLLSLKNKGYGKLDP